MIQLTCDVKSCGNTLLLASATIEDPAQTLQGWFVDGDSFGLEPNAKVPDLALCPRCLKDWEELKTKTKAAEHDGRKTARYTFLRTQSSDEPVKGKEPAPEKGKQREAPTDGPVP